MKIKKILVGILSVVMLAVGAVTATSCNGGETSTSAQSGANLPANLREGYTTKYEGFTGTVHNVANKDNGKRIYGRIFRPDNFDENKEYPVLIMSHGFNSIGMDGTDAMVKGAIANGMLCYTFDFRGGGKMSQSVGKTTEMTVKTEISDLESVIADIKALPYTKDNKLALFGHSFGGLVTAMTAGYHSNDVAAVILHAPATSYDITSIYSSKEEIEALPDAPIRNQNMDVGKQFFLDFWGLDIFGTMVNWKKDILLMCGTADGGYGGVVKTTNYYNENGCNATLLTLEGAEHSFKAEEYNSVLPDVVNYLTHMGVLG